MASPIISIFFLFFSLSAQACLPQLVDAVKANKKILENFQVREGKAAGQSVLAFIAQKEKAPDAVSDIIEIVNETLVMSSCASKPEQLYIIPAKNHSFALKISELEKLKPLRGNVALWRSSVRQRMSEVHE